MTGLGVPTGVRPRGLFDGRSHGAANNTCRASSAILKAPIGPIGAGMVTLVQLFWSSSSSVIHYLARSTFVREPPSETAAYNVDATPRRPGNLSEDEVIRPLAS